MESGPGDVMGPASGSNRREAARLSAIVAIHTEVSAANFDPAQVADAIAWHTRAMTSARGVVVGILEGGSLEVLASKGLDLVPDDAHSTLVTDLVRLGIQRGGVETIPDVEADRRISGPQNTKAWI